MPADGGLSGAAAAVRPVSLPAPRTAAGVLERGDEQLPVTLSFASAVSVFASFPASEVPDDLTVFDRLVVRLEERDVELTRCRLHREGALPEGQARLVFLDDLYDCRTLLFHGRLVNLRSFFQNVPLVLAHKNAIAPELREHTANVLYDLSAYKKYFDEQDRLLAREPRHVNEAAQEALLASEGRSFLRHFDGWIDELSQLVAGFDKEAHERHGFYLRRLAWEFIATSEFLRRTNLKPRGYAGDADMMVMAYENRFEGPTLFSKLMHKHPLETPAAQAVRNRRALVAAELSRARERAPRIAGEPFRFLSVAAGPACELEDVFREPEDAETMEGVVLDQDPWALQRARATAARVAERLGRTLHLEYVSDSVRTMVRRPLAAPGRRAHFIYSMGLFDYLTPPVARAVLSRLYGMLAPGGTLLVGNYHVDCPTRFYMAYWMDWVLYYRTETQLLDLATGLPVAEASLTFDPTRCQMFLRLDRAA